MATLQEYMRGQKTAHLDIAKVSPSWMKSPPQILELTNKSFKLYKKAWDGVKDMPKDIKTNIHIDLTDAAREGMGFGLGPGDLEACFQHLIANNNHWVSEDGSNYSGPQVSGALNFPSGITNFLNAVDSRGDALKKNYKKCSQFLIELASAKKNNNWGKIGEYSGYLEKTVTLGTPFIWISSLSASDSLTNYQQRASKWISGFSFVHSFLDTFNKYNALGTSKAQAIGIAAFKELLSKGVPIIGDAYAKVFDALPGAIKWARELRAEQDRQIKTILGAGNW